MKIASTQTAPDPTDHTPNLAAMKLGTWTQYSRHKSDISKLKCKEQKKVAELPLFALLPDYWEEGYWKYGQLVPPRPIYPTVAPGDEVYLLHVLHPLPQSSLCQPTH